MDVKEADACRDSEVGVTVCLGPDSGRMSRIQAISSTTGRVCNRSGSEIKKTEQALCKWVCNCRRSLRADGEGRILELDSRKYFPKTINEAARINKDRDASKDSYW